jgi:hypothetical protein
VVNFREEPEEEAAAAVVVSAAAAAVVVVELLLLLPPQAVNAILIITAPIANIDFFIIFSPLFIFPGFFRIALTV